MCRRATLTQLRGLPLRPLWSFAGFLETELSALFGPRVTFEEAFYLELTTHIGVEDDESSG